MADVFMDIPEVEKISQDFEQLSEVLNDIAQVMETVSDTLKSTAFIGYVGGAVVISWLERIRPVVENLSTYCEEIHNDVDIAVQNYINGDMDSAGRFG